jgi:AraC-like DNA-binding protein
MPDPQYAARSLDGLAWLGEVRDVHHPINPTQPLIVRSKVVKTGAGRFLPTVPHPEQHPYCEIGILIEGKIIQFAGSEKVERLPGSLLLLGPGIPHYALHLNFPHRSINIHLLPILLLEMGPRGDGARMLSRFTRSGSITERVLQPPARLRGEITNLFRRMALEYEHQKTGSELQLRATLMEIFVKILRWEENSGKRSKSKPDEPNWLQIEKILRFIHEGYTEPIYIDQIAKAVGLSVNRIQNMFRDAVGMSCVHYLRAYRISQAKTLLCMPDTRVAEVALAVGFETLSHFNTSFRDLIGMSPTEYVESQRRK